MPEPHLTVEEVREILTSANDTARDAFLDYFGDQIEEMARRLSLIHERFQAVYDAVPKDERSGWTQGFLYAGFDCLVSSTQLLVFGHILAAGNLMRSWGEAIAMALLCSSDRLAHFDELQKYPERYSVQASVDRLKQKKVREVLGIEVDALERFKEIERHYSNHSHSSAWSISARQMRDRDRALTLAGEFDPGKIDYYTKEISLRLSACERLHDTIVVAERNLNERYE